MIVTDYTIDSRGWMPEQASVRITVDPRDARHLGIDEIKAHLAKLLTLHEECDALHPDTIAARRFAEVMANKLAATRAKGRGGWETCSVPALWDMLIDHVGKGDPLDVACLAMMIYWNSQRDAAAREAAA